MVVTENWATRDKCLHHLGEAHLVSLGGFWVRSGVCGCETIDTRNDLSPGAVRATGLFSRTAIGRGLPRVVGVYGTLPEHGCV